MNFDLSDEQKMLAEQARGLLADRAPFHRLRTLIDAKAEWDEPLWKDVAGMGFLGARIPEAYGGLGLSDLDLGVISEELGRANVALPYFSSIILAADAIAMAGSDAQKAKWLPRLAAGEMVACFAYAEGRQGWRPDVMAATYTTGHLAGRKSPVADAGIADIAVVLCQESGTETLVVVDLAAEGVRREKLESFDQLRAHYQLEFSNAPAERLELATPETVDRLFDRAAVQQAFENVGAAEASIHMARDYAMDRKIFGRPLASYQAIKHKLADALLQTEFARSNAFYAGWAATEAPEEVPAAAAAARLSALAAFETAARENLQIHGGIGYTFESNCHFFYRRERLNALALGPKQYWADRLIGWVSAKAEDAA